MKPRCDHEKKPRPSGQEGGAEPYHFELQLGARGWVPLPGRRRDWAGVDDRRRGKAAPGEGDRSRRGLAFPGASGGTLGERRSHYKAKGRRPDRPRPFPPPKRPHTLERGDQ